MKHLITPEQEKNGGGKPGTWHHIIHVRTTDDRTGKLADKKESAKNAINHSKTGSIGKNAK